MQNHRSVLCLCVLGENSDHGLGFLYLKTPIAHEVFLPFPG